MLSSPSGAGKTTLCKELLRLDDNLRLSVSATTRPMREGEENGRDYHFLARDDFQRDVQQDLFIEHVESFGHLYGTPKKSVGEFLNRGFDVLLDVDWRGGERVAQEWPGRCARIFILPPSLEALESRLLSRGLDDESVIKKRLARAEDEIPHWIDYDYVVVNDELPDAIEDLMAIVRAERLKAKRFHAYV